MNPRPTICRAACALACAALGLAATGSHAATTGAASTPSASKGSTTVSANGTDRKLQGAMSQPSTDDGMAGARTIKKPKVDPDLSSRKP